MLLSSTCRSQNHWPLKVLLFKRYWRAIHSLHPISLFNFFYHLSFSVAPSIFCQKQSVDFPADCPALPQSQTWRGKKNIHEGGQMEKLKTPMMWEMGLKDASYRRHTVRAESIAELHSCTCSPSPVCLFQPFLSPWEKENTHPEFWHRTAQSSRGDLLRGALNYMCVSFAAERRDAALNSSRERQTEEETDKEKAKSTCGRTEIKERRVEKQNRDRFMGLWQIRMS